MKRKELTKRLMSITMAAMMITTMVPTTAFASEADFFADSAEAVSEETNQENWGASEEFSDGMGFTDDGAEVAAEDGTDDAVELYADGEQGIATYATDEEKAATEYLKVNYIDNNKIITNGGTGITKGTDGLSYTVGLKTDRGSAISSIFLKKESSGSAYKSGWYFGSQNKWVNPAKTPSNRGSVGINRPTADEGEQTFTATLRLFASGIADSVINDEAQAAENALATQDFEITLLPAEPVYTMTIKVVDEAGDSIDDATVTLEKNWSTVSPRGDGAYVMEKGGSYTLTVKKTGYNDYKESHFTFNPTEVNTVKTITLKNIVYRNIKFNLVDKTTKAPIENATIVVKGDVNGFEIVNPETDGSYKVVDGKKYYYRIEAKNYEDVSNTPFTPEKDETITVEMVKNISEYSVIIKPVDSKGNAVENAAIKVTYEEEDPWDEEETDTVELKPLNGSYTMKKGIEYTYTITADGYETATGKYTPSGTEEIINLPVTMKKTAAEITECKITIQPMDGETPVSGAEIKVTYEDYDTYYQNPYTAELKANEDGTYTMKKDVEYTYSVKADGYEDVTGKTYTPDGSKDTDTISVVLTKKPVDTEDQKAVDAIKAKFDAEMGALRPDFATDKNILDIVTSKIRAYTDVDASGVKVSIKTTDTEKTIGLDGVIHYRAEALDSWGRNYKNVSLVFVFEKNGAKAVTEERVATVCWDRDYYNDQMKAEKESLTWDKIKGSNTSENEVNSDLTLPQCMTSSARTAWSKIIWESSDPSVLSIDGTGYDSIIDPKKGTIHQPKKDTEVTLTATFNVNDSAINDRVEKVSDFATYTKEFKVTVKGTGEVGPTEDELLAILDKYYVGGIEEFGNEGVIADLANCKGDLQLPRYTRIKDENNNYVFNNKEITVTSENENVIKINGYRAVVDRFASNEVVTVDLVITFTRDGVMVSKKIPVTVKPVTEAEVQGQLDMMEYAKAHYFDGINDNQYADKDSITGNLHSFLEMIFDENGNAKWIYKIDEKSGKGIIPDDQFKDTWEMEGAGYNKFKSSNNAVVAHENLVVNRRETDTEITISSVLSSELYKDVAEKHPNNTVLQKLYKQPVSVTVTIKGTKSATDGLEKEIQNAKDLLASVKEGTEAGQYPTGTKDALQKAIDAATEVLNKENVTEEELNKAIKDLKAAESTAMDAQIPMTADITVRINKDANKLGTNEKITVKATDAAAYGYEKPENMKKQVTVADALYALHAALYGEKFNENPSDYLNISSNGWLNGIFGVQTSYIGYYVNNVFPTDEAGNGTVANDTVLKTGDELEVFLYGDTNKGTDKYLYFSNTPDSVESGKDFSVTLMTAGYTGSDAAKDCTVVLKNTETGETVERITDENGIVTFKADKGGKYQIYVSKTPYAYAVLPTAELKVKAAQKPVDPEITKKPEPTETPQPTVTPTPAASKTAPVLMLTAKGKKTSVSLSWNKVKGATEYRIYGAKCGASYKLLKKVSGNYKSWTKKKLSKNTAYKYFIVAYDKDGKIAKSANIHVTTAGGKYAAVSAITVNKKAVTVKKGKTKKVNASITTTGKNYLKHTRNVRYISSNQKVATVDKNGKIKGIKKGKCYIYCYAQNGMYKKVKVTVK